MLPKRNVCSGGGDFSISWLVARDRLGLMKGMVNEGYWYAVQSKSITA